MPLTDDENEWVIGLLEAYDGNEKETSEWRRGFMADQIDRHSKYGKDMFLSPKQWNVLKKVAEDLNYDGPSADGGFEADIDDEIPF